MPTLPIIFVDGDIKIVCEAPQAARIRELEALDSKIYDLTKREDKLGEIANSGTPDNCARRAWEQAGEELAQARQSQSAITSCLEDKTWGQAAEWLAQAHLSPDKSAFEKNFEVLFAKLSCLQKVVLARRLGWYRTAIVGAAVEITVRPRYLP